MQKRLHLCFPRISRACPEGVFVLTGSMHTGGGDNTLIQLAMQLLQNHQSGMSGLLQQLSASGLGDSVQSWIGTGANQPVSADALGALAAKLGLDPSVAAQGLAQVLPQVEGQATPNGSLEDSDKLLQDGLAALGGLFR